MDIYTDDASGKRIFAFNGEPTIMDFIGRTEVAYEYECADPVPFSASIYTKVIGHVVAEICAAIAL